jgi:hypothetical protein
METQQEYIIPVQTEAEIDLKYSTLFQIADYLDKLYPDVAKVKDSTEKSEIELKFYRNLEHLRIALTMVFWGDRDMSSIAEKVVQYTTI